MIHSCVIVMLIKAIGLKKRKQEILSYYEGAMLSE